MKHFGENLLAEAIAFPLASVDALRIGATSVPGRQARAENPDGAPGLAGLFVEEHSPHYRFAKISLDQLTRMRDRAWAAGAGGDPFFPSSDRALTEYVSYWATKFLVLKDRFIELTVPGPQASESFELWPRLTACCAPDLFHAAYLAQLENDQGVADLLLRGRICVKDLDALGLGKFTDQHLHLWACLPFNIFWVYALTPSRLEHQPYAFPPIRFRGRNAGLLLGCASVGRLLLGHFLWTRSESKTGDFTAYLHWFCKGQEHGQAVNCLSLFLPGPSPVWQELLLLLENGLVPEADSPQAHLARTSAGLARFIQQLVDRDQEEDAEAGLDPLTILWSPAEAGLGCETAELTLLYEGLKYLREQEALGLPDAWFAYHFWQLVRFKNCIYRKIVQQEGFQGLAYFSQFYGSIPKPKGSVARARLRIAEATQNPRGAVEKLEFRVGPDSDRASAAKALLQDLTEYRAALRKPAGGALIGLTVHFIKSRDPLTKEEPGPFPLRLAGPEEDVRQAVHWTCADFSDEERPFRFQRYLRAIWGQMEVLLSLFDQAPALSRFVRAIDVASRERLIPNWLFAQVFREFRRRLSPPIFGFHDEFLQPHLTAHVGEDFDHLLSGLRNIHEVLTYFGYDARDRLGHGLALGMEVDHWADQRASQIFQQRDEYLDDLLWCWIIYQEHGIHLADFGTEEFRNDELLLKREIESVAAEIFQELRRCQVHRALFKDTPSVNELVEAYKGRFNLEHLKKLGIFEEDPGERDSQKIAPAAFARLETGLLASASRSFGLLAGYFFCCEGCARTSGVDRSVSLPRDGSKRGRMKRLQQWLRKTVAQNDIIVESCPSSNRLIANLDTYDNHPVFVFAPPGGREAEVRFTVNADDPVTFNTTVEDEFAFLYLAMTKEFSPPIPPHMAQAWLQQRISVARETSFVYAPTKDDGTLDRSLVEAWMEAAHQELSGG